MRTYFVCSGRDPESTERAAKTLHDTYKLGEETVILAGNQKTSDLICVNAIARALYGDTVFNSKLEAALNPDTSPAKLCELVKEAGLPLRPEQDRDLVVIAPISCILDIIDLKSLQSMPSAGEVYPVWQSQAERTQ